MELRGVIQALIQSYTSTFRCASPLSTSINCFQSFKEKLIRTFSCKLKSELKCTKRKIPSARCRLDFQRENLEVRRSPAIRILGHRKKYATAFWPPVNLYSLRRRKKKPVVIIPIQCRKLQYTTILFCTDLFTCITFAWGRQDHFALLFCRKQVKSLDRRKVSYLSWWKLRCSQMYFVSFWKFSFFSIPFSTFPFIASYLYDLADWL